MHAEKHARFFGDGVFVVCEARAICGADFTERGAALLHDFGDAEAVADFDEFAARDEDFAVTREGGESEKDGGGTIVDDDSGFGAGEAFEEMRGVDVALAAGTELEVVFEIRILRGGAAEFFDGGLGERGAAEIGVKDDAGGVDHGLERLGEDLLDGVSDFVLQSGGIERKDDRAAAVSGRAFLGGSSFGSKACTKIGERSACNFEEEIAVDALGERGQARCPKQFVHRRDLAE